MHHNLEILMIKDFLYVGAGGALGSICRYSLTLLAASLPQGGLCATIAANVIGSFLIGMAMVSARGCYLFCAVGFCGGFTTFSTFSSQSLKLLQSGDYAMAIGYMAASVLLSVASVGLGCYVGSLIRN